ncbi:hypothetical protein K9M42_02165 [Patescibacteria group bacterium]|nr:hypothetical protein [Patescibacteria group bacterium]
MSEDFGYGVFDLDEVKKKLSKNGNVVDIINYMKTRRDFLDEFWDFFLYKMKFDSDDLYKIMNEVDDVRARAWRELESHNPSLKNLISLIRGVEFRRDCQHIKGEAWDLLRNHANRYKKDDNFKKYVMEIMCFEEELHYEAWELLKSYASLDIDDYKKIISKVPNIRDSAYKELLATSSSEKTLLELLNISESTNFSTMNYSREDFVYPIVKKILNSNPSPRALFSIIKNSDCSSSFRQKAWAKLKNSNDLFFLIKLLFCDNIEEIVSKKKILEILFNNENRLDSSELHDVIQYCHNNNLDSLKIRAAKIAIKKGAVKYWLWKDFGINERDLE